MSWTNPPKALTRRQAEALLDSFLHNNDPLEGAAWFGKDDEPQDKPKDAWGCLSMSRILNDDGSVECVLDWSYCNPRQIEGTGHYLVRHISECGLVEPKRFYVKGVKTGSRNSEPITYSFKVVGESEAVPDAVEVKAPADPPKSTQFTLEAFI